MWYNYFQKIYLLNLAERFDRLYDATNLLNDYEIPFIRYEATKHSEGYMGLIMSMKKLFTECLENGEDKILIFEDDVKFCEEKEYFHFVMEEAVKGLMCLDWQQFYLGIQHVRPFNSCVKPHILLVTSGYSTHAVAYNKEFMEYFVTQYVAEPCDNWMVREYQPFGKSFCAYPLLATQQKGYSDIGGEVIDWDYYISSSYQKATRHLFEK